MEIENILPEIFQTITAAVLNMNLVKYAAALRLLHLKNEIALGSTKEAFFTDNQ